MAATQQAQQGENLALLYQEFLTAVVRLQGGMRNIDNKGFRQAATRAVQEAERNATSLHYEPADIQKASLAVVALLDEVALGSNAFDRAEWTRMPLALELYQESRAGQVVFDNIENCLRTPVNQTKVADILEVYFLCLLLGFEGRYAGRRGDRHELIERIRVRIEMIRPPSNRLTPAVDVPAHSLPAPQPPPASRRLVVSGAIFIAGALVLFILLKLHLWWFAQGVAQMFAGRYP